MAVRTSVEVEVGRPVVRRIAGPEDAGAIAGLEAEAAALERAAGRGVVAVVRAGPTDLGWELVTAHVGLPLDAARIGSVAGLARVGAAVAGVLADLHARGTVHGALELEHVALGSDRRPVLSGFGRGVPGAGAADDVAALGRLLLEVAAALGSPDSVEQGRRDQLVDVARRATDPEPARRPVARRLAAELERLAPSADRPAATARSGRVRATPIRAVAAARIVAVALVGVAVVAVAVGLGGASPEAGPGVASSSTAPAVAPRTSELPGATEPTASTELPPCVAAVDHPVSVAGGCDEDITVGRGVVEVGGRRRVVARPGDDVLVADWGCDGSARPIVLRPSTGEVLMFAAPADGVAPVVERAERVEGAEHLRAELDDHGCAVLYIVTETGAVRLT